MVKKGAKHQSVKSPLLTKSRLHQNFINENGLVHLIITKNSSKTHLSIVSNLKLKGLFFVTALEVFQKIQIFKIIFNFLDCRFKRRVFRQFWKNSNFEETNRSSRSHQSRHPIRHQIESQVSSTPKLHAGIALQCQCCFNRMYIVFF